MLDKIVYVSFVMMIIYTVIDAIVSKRYKFNIGDVITIICNAIKLLITSIIGFSGLIYIENFGYEPMKLVSVYLIIKLIQLMKVKYIKRKDEKNAAVGEGY